MPSDPFPQSPEELEVKNAELEVRRLEATKAMAAISLPWWRRADPLVLAVLAGILTLLGNMAVTIVNNHNSLSQEQKKAADDLSLEQEKARFNLVLQAMATNDAAVAKRNIHFFIDAGLLQDPDCKIRDAIDQDQPVLPSLSGVAPPTPPGAHSPIEIATLYNFPGGFDGRGVTIGVLELGGAIVPEDMTKYFKTLDLPVPDVTPVSVDGAEPKSDSAFGLDTQVMLDVEILGAIAPRARILLYYAPNTPAGFAHAISRAAADKIAVLSISFGGPESNWKDEEIKEINAALEQAARQNITVLAPAGANGVTAGVGDGHRHVDFPGSSQWVLAVGGTTLKSEGGHISSETVWSTPHGGVTGGGVSEKFERPDWQSGVSVPNRDDGKPGRGVPDVVASADPALGVPIIVHGQPALIGGTSVSVPLWAGLIVRIDQALGYNVGYLNPRLYQEIGPSGVLHNITVGDNSISGVKGYSAKFGWSAVAGWGSPDGTKLLNWLRAHPNPPDGQKLPAVACVVSSK
jgi:kumamolisin